MEIWKGIPNYEGFYEVSHLGNVRSLKRRITKSNGVTQTRKSINLKPYKSKGGYLVVDLRTPSNRKAMHVHKLVAIAFLNHKPNGYKGLIVDHIDNNRLNNKLENLQLTTARHNCSKDRKNKYSKYTGVTFDKRRNKWVSRIRKNNKQIHLGSFKTELEASKAYQKELKNVS